MFALWHIVTTIITLTLVTMEIITSVSASSSCPYYCDCERRKKSVSCLHSVYDDVPDQLPFDLKSLHLEFQNLTILDQLSDRPLTNLRHLTLPRNNIRLVLEDALSKAPYLKTLDLSHNDLDCLPRAISKQTKLKELYLSNNEIGLLDSELFVNLTQLQALDLSGNQLMFLPENLFTPLRYLQTLDLSNNSLIFLTKDIFGDLYRLEELRLSNNKIRDVTHGWLSGMPNLWVLEMNFALHQTRSTSVHQERLISNPSGLIMTNIENLSLAGNGITFIPCHHLAKMPALMHVNFSHNVIQRVEKNCFKAMSALENLDFSSNHIVDLEDGAFHNLTSLQQINLSRNMLHYLPPGLLRETGVTDFDVSFNRIMYIKNNTYNHAQTLENLHLQHNRIRSIASHAFRTTYSLTYVNLQRNVLVTIKDQFSNLTTLTALLLKHNLIRHIADNALEGTSLETLLLDHNHLTTLDESIIMYNRNMMRVSLHSNPWNCDCRVRWIKHALDDSAGSYPWSYELDVHLLQCAAPPKYANRTIFYDVPSVQNMMCTTYASRLAIQLIVSISFAIIITSTVMYVLKLYCKIKKLEKTTGADTSKCLS